ncbi:MAG: SBBP repeat-containing protein, partial [Lewinella sp.]|nr:SBBP repeat-containing protein [Lewinella sp.]
MSAYKVSLTLLLFCLILPVAYSQTDLHPSGIATSQSPAFIENRGQILDQNHRSDPELLYLLPSGNGLNVLLKRNSFSYDTYQRVHTDDRENAFSFHRLDISFPGAADCPEINAERLSPEKLHFTYPEVRDVPQYRKITYLQLYPNIDLEMIAAPNTGKAVEYNFILHPGARLSDIRMQYQGGGMLACTNGKLQFQLAHGRLTESIPASFWEKDRSRVAVNYQLIEQEGESVTFGFSAPVDRIDQTLIIDPIPHLDWGTYLGGNEDDSSRDMTMDAAGNVYIVGTSKSPNAIATTGTHQNVLAGNNDAFIAKFSNDGIRLWSTYLGGSEDEMGQNIDLDGSGNIYVTGVGSSLTGVTSTGAAQENFAGGSEDA